MNTLTPQIYKIECCYLHSQQIRINRQTQSHKKIRRLVVSQMVNYLMSWLVIISTLDTPEFIGSEKRTEKKNRQSIIIGTPRFCVPKYMYLAWESPWCRGGSVGLVTQGSAVRSPAPATWKSCLTGWKFMDSHKIIIKTCGWDNNACLGVRNTSSIGAWPNSLDRRPPKYCIVYPLELC